MGKGGEHISVNSVAGLVCVMLIWFVMTHNCLGGGFFFIQFFFFLQSTLTNYCKHFPKSICREFISPEGYIFHQLLYEISDSWNHITNETWSEAFRRVTYFFIALIFKSLILKVRYENVYIFRLQSPLMFSTHSHHRTS